MATYKELKELGDSLNDEYIYEYSLDGNPLHTVLTPSKELKAMFKLGEEITKREYERLWKDLASKDVIGVLARHYKTAFSDISLITSCKYKVIIRPEDVRGINFNSLILTYKWYDNEKTSEAYDIIR